ncbi:hypothetical protein AYI68_g2388 [Smittium mucronatum]|uniref:Uncharacterized protein n=1 Tax=Smittium mucronatum TaxID=133383 RepID=A0A1R0H2T5_9FUNG|nr:hypothetical protein AYI68_g2388 [Smittium mucronatum]
MIVATESNLTNELKPLFSEKLDLGKGISSKGIKVVSDKEIVTIVKPDSLEPELHYYPRVLNSIIHPVVLSFFNLGNEMIARRYCHLNSHVDEKVLYQILCYSPEHFKWAGSDLFNVATKSGKKQMVVVETNSCPSGQKSMPSIDENHAYMGYKKLLANSLGSAALSQPHGSTGKLAVIYDKNIMEASGYAVALADMTNENVFLVPYYNESPNSHIKWIASDEDNSIGETLHIRDELNNWHEIRACFRYVTQKPWNRIPIKTKTKILNPVVSCLAGGRNKMMASFAYEMYNIELRESGLSIRFPETIKNVTKSEIPQILKSMDYLAVLKDPYSNAGQGVYTILDKSQLSDFMNSHHHYEKFIVQSLVGNSEWSSHAKDESYYHVCTVPNAKGEVYVNDIRMMVSGSESGFSPLCIYSRRARKPLVSVLNEYSAKNSWDMLGTNLSVKQDDGSWTTETGRLSLMDHKDFNKLGLGIDDLIDCYIQTVLSTIAIDKMCKRLINSDKSFNFELFSNLNTDKSLIDEIRK